MGFAKTNIKCTFSDWPTFPDPYRLYQEYIIPSGILLFCLRGEEGTLSAHPPTAQRERCGMMISEIFVQNCESPRTIARSNVIVWSLWNGAKRMLASGGRVMLNDALRKRILQVEMLHGVWPVMPPRYPGWSGIQINHYRILPSK